MTMALVLAPSVSAQGAIPSTFGYAEPASFDNVGCVGKADSKPAPGVLNFDATTQVRCEVEGEAKFSILYASVTRLVLHHGEQNEHMASAGWFSLHSFMRTKDVFKPLEKDRYLTFYFNDPQGRARSSDVRLDTHDWQLLVNVASNKTGRHVERDAPGDNWNFFGHW
jgi:hypothetical protein